MADEGSAKPAREATAKKSRAEREAEVRRKYDFGVIRSLRQEKGLTIEKFACCGVCWSRTANTMRITKTRRKN